MISTKIPAWLLCFYYYAIWNCSLTSYIDLIAYWVKFKVYMCATCQHLELHPHRSLLDNHSTINGNPLLKFLATPLKYQQIKTHGSESRGQEEAACTRVFWPTRPLQ